MPFLENGDKVDVILNPLGVINRLNSMQIIELSINFTCNHVVEKMRTMKTKKEKEAILFDIVEAFNTEQCESMKVYYKKLSNKEKDDFFDEIDKYGIYIHMRPLWEDRPIFDKLRDIYRKYDWIKPLDVYVNRFGRKIKILKPMVVGEIYMIKLKQSSKKGFSARSTGALSRRGVPEKSSRAKEHQDLYSTTPIRIGIDENLNSNIGASSTEIAKLHLFYRSSVIGRLELGNDLLESTEPLKDFHYAPEFKNRNVEILQAYFKAMGLKIEFLEDKYEINIDLGNIQSFTTDEKLFIGTSSEYRDFQLMNEIRAKFNEDICVVGTREEVEEMILDEFNKAKSERDS